LSNHLDLDLNPQIIPILPLPLAVYFPTKQSGRLEVSGSLYLGWLMDFSRVKKQALTDPPLLLQRERGITLLS